MNTMDSELPQKRNFRNNPIPFLRDPGSSCTGMQEEKVNLKALNVRQRWWAGVLKVLSNGVKVCEKEESKEKQT